MSPFSRPNQCTKKALSNNVANSTAKALTKSSQDFLEIQQMAETIYTDGLDEPGDFSEVNQAQFEHNTLVVQDMVFQAITEMLADENTTPTTSQLRDAQAIMPAVSYIQMS
jgi:hypothetical protein